MHAGVRALAASMSSGPVARLGRDDFNRPTLHVARDLLGKVIAVRASRGRVRRGMIVETEAYRGPRDLASHAAGGRRTRRVEPLYGEGGPVYVYLVYGIHWLLNFATAGADLPEGVLIRGILADPDGDARLVSGPGRVTQHFGIDRRHDGDDVAISKRIWVEDRGARVSNRQVARGPRVGVDYAGAYWASRPWRLWIK